MGADHPTDSGRARRRCTGRATGVFNDFSTQPSTWDQSKMLLLSCFILASLSCCVGMAAIWFCVRVRKLLAGASVRSLAQLSIEVDELTSACELQKQQLRKLSQRVGMAAVRHKGEELREADEETAPARGSREERLNKLREIARAKGFRL